MKNPHAVALGKLGGAKGGPARAAALPARRRREIAREAGVARWKGLTDVERRNVARLAARARWQRAAEAFTSADAPVAVRLLLKPYDPKALRWAIRDDRHTIVREILVRGDALAKRWLRRKLSRSEVRQLIAEYRGAGSNEPDRQILRARLGLSVIDLPVRPYIGNGAFAQRAAEKQRSRDEDKRRLERGEVSAEELRAENSFFNLSLPIRIVDFGRPLRRPR
ncbi:MAG TPA: hypothetical protein VHG72_18310 [Polyangia bacterium]|nr:hypothetical protein [Polyangia bacterium]